MSSKEQKNSALNASLIAAKISHNNAKTKYELNLKYCKSCGKVFSYEERKKTFCNHSCAAVFNNKGVRRHGYAKECVYCGEKLNHNARKFCSKEHMLAFKKEIKEKEIIKTGKIIGNHNSVRKYLINKNGHKCELCDTTEWKKQPVPLILDHIDGNSDNCNIENLRMICRNCDGLLPTFAGRNKKYKHEETKRMKYRKDRYKNGLSW